MNENVELLMYMYKSAEMGVYTTTSLLQKLKDRENNIKHVLESELKEYERHFSVVDRTLKKYKQDPKETSFMTKMMSDIGITIETIKDNSDSAIAQMIVEGMTMGIVEMQSKINKYNKICDKKILKIANSFLKFQECEVEKLKEFM